MAWFDEVKRGLTHAGKQAAEKTKELTDTVRIRTKLSAEREELEKHYAMIGREVYAAAKEEDKERFAAAFLEISAGLERIAGLERELAVIDGHIFCAECGARIEKGAVFCSKCGAKVKETERAAGKESGEDREAKKEQETACMPVTETVYEES